MTLCALDGNGDSDRPGTLAAYHVDRIKDDILAVADAAKAPSFVLWGVSYGDNVGRYLAASSDRVSAMVYIGIPFGPAVDPIFRQQILARTERPMWLTALLGYPAVEPSDMKPPTLWVVGTANVSAMNSVKAYESELAGSPVTIALLDGLTHPQEFANIDVALPREIEFTRKFAR